MAALNNAGLGKFSNGMRDRLLANVTNCLFGALIIGIFYTQVIRFPYYSRLSKNNSIRIIPIEGPRGNIYDRNGAMLVTNRIAFDVAMIHQEIKERAKLVRLLSDCLGMSGREIAGSLESSSLKPYAPVTIAQDIDKEKAIMLEEASLNVSGIMIEAKSKRSYLYNHIASHIFGYLGEVGEEELEGLKDYGYRVRDLVGRAGIEKYYDIHLKGTSGGQQVEVDNKGRQTRILGLKEPTKGNDLYLTIDIRLQMLCDKLLGSHKGAIIVIDPKSGEVLALASHPAFDPNIFVKPGQDAERLRLMKDKAARPMSNRAISGIYPPGSVFKVVTASAGLETKKISHRTNFFCGGKYKLGSATFDCWKEEGHLSQNLREGIMNSCNVFFYQVGRAVGVDPIESYARLFGFGRPTGIDLPDEVKGIVPGRAWKGLHKREAWYEGETLNYAIGQGYLSVTPIQILNMMTAIANSGSLVRPYLVRRIGTSTSLSADGERSRSAGSSGISNVSKSATKIGGSAKNFGGKRMGLREETIREVRSGLYDVVNNENGTGRRAKVGGAQVAGKTGTAENPHGPTHAWFAGFAPYDDPKVCLVVFMEHGGKGGVEPAAIAHDIFAEAKDKGYLD